MEYTSMGLVHPPLLPAPAASAHGFGVRALEVRNLGWTQALSAWDFEFEFRVSGFGFRCAVFRWRVIGEGSIK